MASQQKGTERKSRAKVLAGLAAVGLLGAGLGVFMKKRQPLVAQVSDELRTPFLNFPQTLVPQSIVGPLMGMGAKMDIVRPPEHDADISVIEGISPDDGHPFSARQIEPKRKLDGPVPAMVWIHGGGHLLGTPGLYDPQNAQVADELGMKVFAVSYRKASEAPFPADVDDCFAALRWVQDNAEGLGIDPERIAVCGDSAGGGLAASVVQRAIGEQHPVAFQGLVYPMLDHRTGTEAEPKKNIPPARGQFVWTPNFNAAAWNLYLGADHLEAELPDYASPLFREDVSTMPPTWIGIGDLDLFYDEAREFADKLEEAGVEVSFDVYEGAYHGFNHLVPKAQVTAKLADDLIAAMANTLRI